MGKSERNKSEKRDRSSTKKDASPSRGPSVTTTPPVPSREGTDSPSLMSEGKGTTATTGTPHEELPNKAATPLFITNAFIAEPRVYALKDIVVGCDFKRGIVRARCTGADLKEKIGKKSGKPFWIVEILVTDTVTRMVSVMIYSEAQLPILPKVGDMIQITGVKPQVASYDARLYGEVQLEGTSEFSMHFFTVPPGDARIPANWSAVSVKAPKGPSVTADDFFKGL